MIKQITAFKNWLLRALQLQLFITIISMPLLIWWGLPLSLLTIVGNLFFNPVLAFFLFLASLTFFTELLQIPNGLLCSALEYTSQAWLSIIAIDGHPWLMGLATVSWWLPLALLLAAFSILHYKKTTLVTYKTALFLGVLIIFCSYITFMARTQAPAYQELTCNRGQVTLLCEQNKLVLIDPGVIGQRISSTSWVEYTLVSHIQRTAGKTSIEYVIALQPSASLFEALTTLMTKIKIGQFYVVSWEGNLPWRWFSNLKTFEHAAREKNIPITWLSNSPHAIALTPKRNLTITPHATLFKRENLRIPVVSVSGVSGAQPFTIYPYAYEKKQYARKNKTDPA